MKKVKVDELVIDGTTYVPKDQYQKAQDKNGMEFVMVRTYSAGVHAGYLECRQGKEVKLIDSIRIWKWEGAASLSQLAMEGTSNPSGCKFGMVVSELILTEAIEVISMTETAKQSIQNVEAWKV